MALTALAGKNAKVVKGSSTVLGMGNWKISGISTDLLETTSFGDTAKKYITGILDYGTLSFSGLYDPSDSTGQNALLTANKSATKVTDIKLYVNSTSYWIADITDDSDAGLYVTGTDIGFDKSGLGTIDFQAKMTGAWTLV